MAEVDPPADGGQADDPEPGQDPTQIPIWAFALVFLTAPVVMTAIPLFLELERAGSPLAAGLLIGHLLGAAGLLGAYLVLRRNPNA